MRTLTPTSSTLSFISVIMLASLVLLLALSAASQGVHVWLAGDTPSRAQRSQAEQGGQTASPNPSGGFDQEERVRQMLAQQYEQRYGTSDNAIRSALNLKGKVADFVGYNAKQNRWLIAESKGSHIGDAVNQIANTLKGLRATYPDAQVELRIYLDAENYGTLSRGGDLSGYIMNAEKHLGWVNDLKQWVYEEIEGAKILVLQAP